MAEPPKILQVTYGAFSCTLEGFEDPVETLIAVAEYFRGLAAADPTFAGGVRIPDVAELQRMIAEAGGGTVEVRIDDVPEDGAGDSEPGAADAETEAFAEEVAPAEDGSPQAAEEVLRAEGEETLAAALEGAFPNVGSATGLGDGPVAGAIEAEPQEMEQPEADAAFGDGTEEFAEPPEPAADRLGLIAGIEETEEGGAIAAVAEDGGAPEPLVAARPPFAGDVDTEEDRPVAAGPVAEETGRTGHEEQEERPTVAAGSDEGWMFGDEDEDDDRPPLKAPEPQWTGSGLDLDFLAAALAVRRSPEPQAPAEAAPVPAVAAAEETEAEASAEVATASAPEPEPEPEPVPEVVSNADMPEPIPAGAYDWGAGEADDWFVSNAEVAAGPSEPMPDLTATGRRWLLGGSPDQDEAQLRRILSKAERKLSDPEVQRRREALAHLKAAVAATEAERTQDEDGPQAEPLRPEMPAVAPAAEQPPPKPLRLVASQRVDLHRMRAALEGRPRPRPVAEEPAAPPAEGPARPAPEAVAPPPSAPVAVPVAEAAAPAPPSAPAPVPVETAAPPRVARAAAPVRGSFAAFAAQAGASTLPEVLEAAAAWLSGEERDVSRAELLDLAAEALPQAPSREEALRVFGTLLRQGRLERVDGGRFRVGAETRYSPDRLAG